jgi:hypothetical protein
MDIEKEFRKLRGFLIRNDGRQFVTELIAVINESAIDFHPSDSAMTKQHFIDIYSTRYKIQLI